MAADAIQDDDGPQHLTQVSRIKHIMLQKHLPSWERLLGSRNHRFCYFDCYAGPGAYEFEGQQVDGSPIIAVRAAQEYLAQAKGHQMTVTLVLQRSSPLSSAHRGCLSPPGRPCRRLAACAGCAKRPLRARAPARWEHCRGRGEGAGWAPQAKAV